VTATVHPPSRRAVVALSRGALAVAVGLCVTAAMLPWLPSVEAWLSAHLASLAPGVGFRWQRGATFALGRSDGSVARLVVSDSCSWAGGAGLLAGIAVWAARSPRTGLRAWAVPALVLGAVNLARIVAVAWVLIAFRGDHLWTAHAVVGSALTGACAVTGCCGAGPSPETPGNKTWRLDVW